MEIVPRYTENPNAPIIWKEAAYLKLGIISLYALGTEGLKLCFYSLVLQELFLR